jgi:hypothetical protein
MKKFVFYIVLNILLAHTIWAQNSNWFEENKPYFKLTVSENGIYKLAAKSVEAVGISNLQINELQLFRRGKQQCIKTIDIDSNGIFNANDYVLFYGQKNDGKLDSALYINPAFHLNPNLNLHADSTAYFLTYSSTGPWLRITKNTLKSNATEITEHTQRTLINYKDDYARGLLFSGDEPVYTSFYSPSVGYCNGQKQNFETSLKLENLNKASNGNITLKTRLLQMHYNTPISISCNYKAQNTESYTNFSTESLSGMFHKDVNLALPALTFTDNLYLQFKINETDNYFSVSSLEISYPQLIKLESTDNTKTFNIANTAGLDYFFTLNNTPKYVWNISDLSQITEPASTVVSSSTKINFTALTNEDQIYVSKNDPTEIKKGRLVVFKKISPKKNSFIIVSNKLLEKASNSYTNPVNAYASYRASIAGGNYDTVVVDTDYLYDYFTFGEYTPLAIRNLCETMCADTSKLPAGLLLIGKGYNKYNTYRLFDPVQRYSLVPTWSDPGTDIPFSMGLGKANKYVQGIPTGRLSAYTPQHVENYLSKLIEHESVADNNPWKKNIVHLSGGANSSQVTEFKNNMANLSDFAQKPYFGASVKAYAKSLDEFVQIFDLSNELNKGVSLVNILGHSSPNVNDVRIGKVNDPSFNYSNKGLYPFIILNGCESGNIFGYSETDDIFCESWINEPDRGSIAFYAHTNLGYVSSFRIYNRILYSNWFNDSLNMSKSMAEMIQKTNQNYISNISDYRAEEIRHCLQMTLTGDPLARIYKNSFVDFAIESQNVSLSSTDGKPITALSDSVAIKFVIKNLGLLPKNKFVDINIKRSLPGGSEVLVKNLITNFVSSSDTFIVYMRLADINSAGENNISVTVDASKTTTELDETNNTVLITKYLPASDMNCLFPKEYSIQSKQSLNLVAQSTDLLKTNQDYFFEIDTTFAFNSPAYQSKTITATSLPTWEGVNLFERISSNKDSVEFFWRVRFKAEGDTATLFANSTFIYIQNGRSGWNQSVYHQFDKDELSQNIIRLDSSKTLAFSNYTLNIKAMASIVTGNNVIDSNQLFINDKPIYSSSFFPRWDDGWNCCTGLILSAFDSKTLRIYKPTIDSVSGWTKNWYGAGLSNEATISRYFFNGFFTAGIITDLIRQIKKVPDGDYILLNPLGAIDISSYDSTAKAKIDELAKLIGTTTLNSSLKGNIIYGAFFRKGYNEVEEQIVYNPSETNIFRLNVSKQFYNPNGNIKSTIIGPSKAWGKMFLNIDKDNTKDVFKVNVLGINKNGSESVIYNNITDAEFDLTAIDANNYPKIRLQANLEDIGLFTPAIIDRWMVTFNDSIPEGTLVVDKTKVDYNTIFTEEEGKGLVSEFQFKNIGEVAFGNPLIIKYKMKNANGTERIEYDTLKKALQPNETTNLSHTYNTTGFSGSNSIEIFVNPQLQEELLYSNNIWTSKVNVKYDKVNPIVDVTFDGRKILNGEIVSPTPSIHVNIKDNNKYLLKTDTIGIKLLMKKNCTGCDTYSQISLQNPNLKYYPASSSENNFRIEYNPEKLEDGTYTFCVQGADANVNYSGVTPYCIEFNVINKSMMSNVFPYPNPFSNFTRFVFTLSGEYIPDEMKIQIMTVSGKVVREITQSEIGPLKIGTNVSEYAWDGKDEYGDKLANGVYLYKVFAKHSGSQYEKLSTDGDKGFKDNWGKLVILR